MKKYAEPELEFHCITVTQTIADNMSGDDNEFDVGDVWGDF